MQLSGSLTRLADWQADSETETARLLLEANDEYNRANDLDQPLSQRRIARERASMLLDQALESEPENAAAMALRGRIELDRGHLDRARELFETALRYNPDDAQLHVNLGYHALLNDEAASAESHFQNALALDKGLATAFCGIAHARRQQGQFESAYLHYQLLMELGHQSDSVYQGMASCMEQLSAESAQPNLKRDAIRLLAYPHLAHHRLGGFVADLLRMDYANHPDGDELLKRAAADELLLLALERTLMTDSEVERLVAHIRQTLMLTSCQTEELLDDFQRLALGLGAYTARTGYLMSPSASEQNWVVEVRAGLSEAIESGTSLEHLSGSFIMLALYEDLFSQSFGPMLAMRPLHEWPEAMQPLMQAALYDLAEARALTEAYQLPQAKTETGRIRNNQVWPFWSALPRKETGSLRDHLKHSYGVADADLPPVVRTLVFGALSGERALELAMGFDDTEIIAVEDNPANLAFARRKAKEMNLENIVFWPWTLAGRFLADGHQVHFAEIQHLLVNGIDDVVSLMKTLTAALTKGGLLHINTGLNRGKSNLLKASQNAYEPTLATMQDIRYFREHMIGQHGDVPGHEILRNADFYSAAGCHNLWHEEPKVSISAALELLSNEVEWKLVSAQDEDSHDLATGPVLEQLRAQRLGSNVRSLVGHGLSLYFQRRR